MELTESSVESVVIVETGFYRGKKVLITGHTGFKGTWLCRILLEEGADITGYALEPVTKPSLFTISGIERQIDSVIGDIRDYALLSSTIERVKPEIIIHMAAQPIVTEGYRNPRETYDINVMGTVNILECIRTLGCVRSFLNVTTDKVYQNKEWVWGYREDDIMNGFDPYSNSKSCSELITSSYRQSFFPDASGIAISTARAGNVIGGGDFAENRIVPDCIRAALDGTQIAVRNPQAIRPFQHVLEPLTAYLMIVRRQYEEIAYAGNYNVGPEDADCITVQELVDLFCHYWGNGLTSIDRSESDAPHEAAFLKLDCSKIKSTFGWKPHWNIGEAMNKTVEFAKALQRNEDIDALMKLQIKAYRED